MVNKKLIDPKPKGGKKIREARKKVDALKEYTLGEAVELVKEMSSAKFDETMEIACMLGVDPKHSDQMVRGVVPMPHGIGKKVTVAVFAKAGKAEEAKAAGADIVGAEDLVDQILAGNTNFDVCIATPDMMGIVGKVAKILGPKGKMPNPKLGTVTPDVAKAVDAAKSGQVEFRVEKAGIIHAGLGKLSFDKSKLIDNFRAFVEAVIKAKPSGAKGTYFKSATICSTMGPAVRIDVSEFQK